MNPVDLHRRLLYVRRAEELLAALYKSGEMRTPTHFSIGEEAVAVGVCSALDLPGDAVFCHHRSHAAYLACGGSFEALAAELYGRETGCSRGRGGSVHLTAREAGFIASSPILGQAVALAAGAALSFRMDGSDRVAVAFFGDAAMEEGVVYETMNYAATKKLPVLFVCANNGYSTESPLSVRQPDGTELTDRAVMFRVGGFKIDGNDVQAVHDTARKALRHVRAGQPCFIEATTYRWLEHVGPHYDHELGRTYRSRKELQAWQENDPLLASAAMTMAGDDELERMDAEIQAELKQAAERARAAPVPDRSSLFDNVW